MIPFFGDDDDDNDDDDHDHDDDNNKYDVSLFRLFVLLLHGIRVVIIKLVVVLVSVHPVHRKLHRNHIHNKDATIVHCIDPNNKEIIPVVFV